MLNSCVNETSEGVARQSISFQYLSSIRTGHSFFGPAQSFFEDLSKIGGTGKAHAGDASDVTCPTVPRT
jgi:hypothetical protein